MEDEVPGQLPLFDLSEEEQLDNARHELTSKLGILRKNNAAKAMELRGMGQILNPGNVALVRVESLIDMIFDDDARLQLDVTFETRMGDILDASLTNVRRSQLASSNAPGTGGGLILG